MRNKDFCRLMLEQESRSAVMGMKARPICIVLPEIILQHSFVREERAGCWEM